MRNAILILLTVATMAQARPRQFAISHTEQVTKGLVSYWSMRNSGTNVYDEWGGNNGTASGGVTFAYTNGIVGTGGRFNGSDGGVNVAYDDSLAFTTAFTALAWIKSDSIANRQAFLTSKDKDGATWLVEVLNSKLRFYAYPYTDLSFIGSTTLESGVWYFVTVAFTSSGTSRLYLNGTEDGSGSIGVLSRDSDLGFWIGYDTVVPRFFNGSIDEARIYNRCLSLPEIKQLYRMGGEILQNR
ncbi:MAG: LamG domain-containing protein [Verrucomicrobia bacterium]|nr:LamG domain-containing protein [Verrucomicrobiota bacterium]